MTKFSHKSSSGFTHQNFSKKNLGGFSLIEMIVAVSIFVTVLFVAMSAFLSIVNGDHKSRAMRVATDNLNLSLEDMSRRIKTGSTYNCGGNLGTNDCAVAKDTFAFTNQDGTSRTIYKRGVGSALITNGVGASGCGVGYGATQGCILREDSGISMIATSPEIDIISLSFYVLGSAPCGPSPCVSAPLATPPTDAQQPVVIIVIEGSLGADATLHAGNAAFKIQTTVTQRAYDN